MVVIAHGFAGSQQLMQPFAITLARNGYVALTFDFPGHGQNPALLPGGLAEASSPTQALLQSLDAVAAFGRKLPSSDGRLALLGHSMASDIVVRYARTHPDVEATVGVSLFAPNGSAGSPRNLLIIDGALEPSFLHEQAYRIVGAAAGGQAREGVTYGSIADGTARRLALADGVEHIGVLYSGESMAEAVDWFNQTFRRPGTGFLDTRGPWLGVLYLGLILLAWPLSGLLPRVAPARLGAGLRWRELLPVAIAPALLTPIVLWRLPSDFLPILLGDYLVLHFAFYGLLTMVGMVLVRRVRGRRPTAASARGSGWKLTVAALAVAAYGVLALGLPADLFVTSLAPGPGRVPLILAMLGGTLLYFVADEWLTRGENSAAWRIRGDEGLLPHLAGARHRFEPLQALLPNHYRPRDSCLLHCLWAFQRMGLPPHLPSHGWSAGECHRLCLGHRRDLSRSQPVVWLSINRRPAQDRVSSPLRGSCLWRRTFPPLTNSASAAGDQRGAQTIPRSG